jgi:hypothetical protein
MNERAVNEALVEMGMPPERVAERRAKQRPFLEALSGRDPLRVIRAGVANGGNDWLPYGWAR